MIEIHHQIKEKLNNFCETKKIPHLLFTGASGTGKRTILFDFLHKIYNNDKINMKTNIMFVNCAHGKGIKFIREDIKYFAKTSIQLSRGVLFKSVVLLNADYLTIDAQSALRRCIEQFSVNTRFFIVVENKQKILNPILSRFCEIYFPEYIDETGKTLNLHQYHIRNKIKIEDFKESRKQLLLEIMQKFNKTMEPSEMDELVNILYNRGFSALDLMNWIQHDYQTNPTNKIKMEMIFHKIRAEYRCEKLFMFYLLNKLNCDLKDEMNKIGFM